MNWACRSAFAAALVASFALPVHAQRPDRPATPEPAKAAPARPAADSAGKPALSREVAWRADLRTLAVELPKLHKNAFAYVQRAAFERAVAQLDDEIPSLSDAQVVWRLQRIAALVRDGHTRVQMQLKYSTRLPVSLLWTDSGLYVVAASAERQSLLGGKVLEVNGLPLAAVQDTIAAYASHENVYGLREYAARLLLVPGALRDLRLGRDSLGATLTLQDAAGARSTVELAAVPMEGFRPAEGGAPVPLYRQRANEKYWFTWVPESRTVYLQYNQCRDFEDFRQLSDSVAKVLDAQHPARLVVDLRLNGGGNSEVIQPLIAAIRARPEINRRGALFAVVGRGTFSSGTMDVVYLKQQTQATVVGEPNGERPNHYGEMRRFTLPNSGLGVTYSTKYFTIVDGNPDATYPDVSTPLTPELVIAGRDPVMEWILAQPVPQR